MSNVATVQKKLARHKAFMTHSVEKRLGDIFSLSHSPRDSEERKGGGFTKVEPLHRSAKLLDVQYSTHVLMAPSQLCSSHLHGFSRSFQPSVS